jgi:UDP-3-O-[3-hydroxymyristoyl] glucosamine N-acyltransferase
MLTIREIVHNEIAQAGFEVETYIHPTAYIAKSATIGLGSLILPNSYIGPSTKIGVGNVIYDNAKISHDAEIGNFNWFAFCSCAGTVTIGNNCFIGMNSTLKSNIRIGNSTLVGASSYVSEDTDEFDVIVPPKSKKNKIPEGVDHARRLELLTGVI